MKNRPTQASAASRRSWGSPRQTRRNRVGAEALRCAPPALALRAHAGAPAAAADRRRHRRRRALRRPGGDPAAGHGSIVRGQPGGSGPAGGPERRTRGSGCPGPRRVRNRPDRSAPDTSRSGRATPAGPPGSPPRAAAGDRAGSGLARRPTAPAAGRRRGAGMRRGRGRRPPAASRTGESWCPRARRDRRDRLACRDRRARRARRARARGPAGLAGLGHTLRRVGQQPLGRARGAVQPLLQAPQRVLQCFA